VLKSSPYYADFQSALENDLGTPKALSVLQTMLKDKELSPPDKHALLREMDSVLGLNLEAAAVDAGGPPDKNEGDPEIEALVAERSEAKKAKNYQRADEIRNMLLTQGVNLEDSAAGTTWRRSPK
jgi:cysteinyl-tRNA synthetase